MLTDAALKALKPKEKIYKVADRDGMYVRVMPSGAISFRLDYRLNGRRETVYLGKYGRDGISLLQAREKCLDARRAVTWADLTGMQLLVPVAVSGPLLDFAVVESIVAHGCRPAVKLCQAGQASIVFNVQLGQGIALAGESFVRTVAIGATAWKPLEGPNNVYSVKAFWLETNPNRAVLRLMGLARKMANTTHSPGISQCARFR